MPNFFLMQVIDHFCFLIEVNLVKDVSNINVHSMLVGKNIGKQFMRWFVLDPIQLCPAFLAQLKRLFNKLLIQSDSLTAAII